ncbi:hypothetical protein BST97_04380 [Nonlabens spongiae]|uniref:Uncharacterized protein n=1 Tax=Nonlabens spongiae TaxID=331648 RepID=A0A1W6MIJ7_9FLAO|nr:hypothetical protein [Nonlabens spongiae]ARN77279.1 hypothetical protein BST97_04380 [Nonlabens spongiae]
MEISDEQIEKLYVFTRKHYVEHYDLQTELVDHLALGIEQQWQEHPNRSFDKALQKEFKKFGVFGFTEIVEQRQKALSKKYMKFIWQHLKEYLTLPKCVFALSVTAALFYLIQILNLRSLPVLTVMAILLVVYFIWSARSACRARKKRESDKEKTWMLEEMIRNQGNTVGAIWLPFHFIQIFIHIDDGNLSDWNPYFLAAICFVFVLMCLVLYVITVEIPKHAETYLRQEYPEYDIA